MSGRARGAALVAALLGLPAGARAGGWHAYAQSNCSDCHTMHNSENGQPMRYDQASTPAPHLLREASALALCVHCHDGSDPNAPDVMAPVSYVADPAGGAFQSGPGVASASGHDLGMSTPAVPPGGTVPLVLTCTTCHDPHGNSAFRNLVGNPSGSGAPPVAPVVNEAVKANGTNPAQVYVASNLVYKSGMSAWCGDCHGEFHGRTTSQEGTASPSFRHPQDQPLSGSRDADAAFWNGPVTNRIRG